MLRFGKSEVPTMANYDHPLSILRNAIVHCIEKLILDDVAEVAKCGSDLIEIPAVGVKNASDIFKHPNVGLKPCYS